jgi:uncharacterized lipoprotein YajG
MEVSLKTFFIAVAIALLAGCSTMHDGRQGAMGSSGASDAQNKSDDIFHSWLN